MRNRNQARVSLFWCFCVLSVCASPAAAATVTAWWKLDDAVPGGTAADSSSSGLNGTYSATGIAAGRATPDLLGSVPDFNGSSGRVTGISGSILGGLTKDMSVSAWIKPDSVSAGHAILSSPASGTGWGFRTTGTEVTFTHYGVLDHHSSGANLQLRGWTHVAATVDNSGKVSLYKNGTLLAGGGTTTGIATTNSFDIASIPGLTNYWFDGALSDVRVYTGALGAAEVQSLATVPNLVGYWALDETTGTYAHDSSGYHSGGNLNGTYQGGFTLGQAAADPAFGTAAKFDGTSGEVNLGSPAALDNLTNNFTLAAWINPAAVSGDKGIFSSVETGSTGWGVRLVGDDLRFTTYGKLDYSQNASILANEWTHVAVTVSGANADARFYVDGTLIGTISGVGPANVGTQNWYIGSLGPQGFKFDGLIDEVRLYNRALSIGEIRELAMYVPEPSSIVLCGSAGVALLVFARRRQQV